MSAGQLWGCRGAAGSADLVAGGSIPALLGVLLGNRNLEPWEPLFLRAAPPFWPWSSFSRMRARPWSLSPVSDLGKLGSRAGQAGTLEEA